ncbi:ATP-binding protein [Thermosulfuriphilus sp.]
MKKTYKCKICRQETAIYLREHRLALCRGHYIAWFERYVSRTINQFKMFRRQDRILVGVSGGKDSLTVWLVLNRLGYQADGFFLDLGIPDFSELSYFKGRDFAAVHGLKFQRLSMKDLIGVCLPDLERKTRKVCSLCGAVKRALFNKLAKEMGYQVIVTGHNLDDEASSLLSNVVNWSLKYLARKYPVLPEGGGFVRKAKPLCRSSVKEIRLYAELNDIDYLADPCPFSENATRLVYAEEMERLEEAFPGAKRRFYIEYLRKAYPVFHKEMERFMEKPLTTCSRCQEPAVNDPCLICRIKAEASGRL